MSRALVGLLALALAAPGCAYSTSRVSARDLADLHHGRRDRALILGGVRLDPGSSVRFRRTDGSYTPWYAGAKLYVNDDGVIVHHAVPFATVVGARVSGLAPEQIALLYAVAPAGSARPELRADGAIELHADGATLTVWIDAFALAIARRDTPWDVQAPPGCDAVRGTQPTGDCAADTASMDTRALAYLRGTLRGAALGAWIFDVPPHGWTEKIVRRAAVLDIADRGVAVTDGIRWADVDGAEVQNLSGGKTFGVVVATIVISAALAPLGVAAGLGSGMSGGGSGGGGGGGAGFGSAVGHGVDGAARVADPTRGLDGPAAAGGAGDRGMLWRDGLTPPSTDGAAPLFAWSMRWRAIVRPTIAFDSGASHVHEAVGRDTITDGMIATARFLDVFELGGGARHLLVGSAMDDTAFASHVMGVMRVGVHLDLDPRRRVAIPMGVDNAWGDSVAHYQLRAYLGVRVRVSRRAYVGVYPMNPVYTRFAPEARVRGGGWSFPTSVELGTSF